MPLVRSPQPSLVGAGGCVFLIDAADRPSIIIEHIPICEVSEGRGLLNSVAAKQKGHVLGAGRQP
jgi:hypothetical protein